MYNHQPDQEIKHCPCVSGDVEFNPWARKITWSRKQQPTPVFLPGKFHGQRSLAGYSPWNLRVGRYWACVCMHTHTQEDHYRKGTYKSRKHERAWNEGRHTEMVYQIPWNPNETQVKMKIIIQCDTAFHICRWNTQDNYKE